jgi:hypothetical protein
VVYEDTPSQARAVRFCDQMVKRFWAQCEFAIEWWSFAELADSTSSRNALSKASMADVVVFACGSSIPSPIAHWIESWLYQRGDREGALAFLTEPTSGSTRSDILLRATARRAGMDYLTEVPQDFAYKFPDSLESYTDRAHQVTGLLEEILHHSSPPPKL